MITSVHYSAFVSLHYDAAANAQDTGCVAGRAAKDPMGAVSDQLVQLWQRRYPAATGIPWRPAMLTTNITDYYAFRATSDKTPGVLFEHGKGKGADGPLLFDHIQFIADLDAAILLEFLGIPEAAMFTDVELTPVAQEVWGATPFVPDFAIPKQWLAAYRAGYDLGAPVGAEHDVGAVRVQHFERGRIVYRPSDGYCSWKG